MNISLSKNKDRIEIITQDVSEYNKLTHFPGLFKDGIYFFIPLKLSVAYNLVHRLQNKFKKNFHVDREVTEFINQSFKLKTIPTSFKYFTEPKDFQEIALRYMYTIGGGGLLLEPGMGKTKVALDYIALMGFKRSLIVCPKALLFVWEDEAALHRPDKKLYVVDSTDWEKEKDNVYNADVVVVNYNKAVTLASELVDVGFKFMGIDEALIKDISSIRTKTLTWLGRSIPCKMLMSGTLVNNSPLDVYAPVRFLEPSLVGNNYVDFKNEYTVEAGPQGRRFIVAYKNVPEIKSILESTSIVMTKEKWLKLPPKKFIDVWVQPSDEQREASIELQSNYVVKIQGKTIEVDNPLTVLCKLVQIANGFIYVNSKNEEKELDDSEVKPIKRETLFFLNNPKLDRLMALLNELKGRRVMIWYNMEGEYEQITRRMEETQIKFLSIKGGEKRTGSKVRTFNNDPSYRVLLCQARAVNYGITVLGKDEEDSTLGYLPGITGKVHTQIFYSLNFSLETYLQQQDRIHRLGQELECEYYRLFTNTAAERHVKEKIDEKQSIRGQVLEDIIGRLGLI